MKVRISKAPDGKGKFINKLGSFMQRAKLGAQVTNMTEIRKEILSRADFGDAPETIANDLANIYGVDYFDMVDEVADLIGSPEASVPETVVKETIPEEEVVEPETEFDYSNNGIAEDVEAEQAEFEDDEDAEEYKKGGSISKNKFVKGVMRSLKKAAEGTQQETSNVANITDIPIGGRQSFVNNWKQGVKDLGNEYYAKQMHDLANTVQPTNVPTEEGLETAGKGREVRQANKQARRATKDFRNAFGDMAAGYFGAPGVPNYLQMLNVVDPSKMPQGQMPPGVTMPGIDFQYKKGPWWTGKREWSAKGVPVGMMPGFGNMQGNMPGYSQGSWNSSWNTGWQKTKVAGTRERVIKAINNAADPTKVNNVELNNNPAASSNINTNPVDIRPGILADLYPNGMPAVNTGVDPIVNPTLDPSLDPSLDPASTQWQSDLERNKVLNAYGSYADYRATPLDTIKSGNVDDPNTYIDESLIWSSTTSQDDFNAANDAYKLADFDFNALTPEQQNLVQQAYYKTKNSKGEEFSSAAGYGSPEYEDKLNALKSEYEKQEDAYYAGQKAAGFPEEYVEWGQEWSNAQPPQEENGGFVDPSQMQPGVLQKFMGGGDDFISPMVQYQNNDLATKNVNDPYYRNGGGIKRFGPGGPNQVDPNYRDAGGKNYQDYINWQGAEGIKPGMSRQAPLSWADWKAEQDAEKNPNGTSNRGNGFQAGDQIRSDGSVWRGNTQISDGKGSIWENNSNRSNTGYNNYIQPKTAPITAPSIGRQILNLVNPFKKDDGDFTWASQRGPITGTNGQPFNPATMGANNLSGYVQDWEGTKNPWYRGGKETFKLTNRYVGTNGQPGTTTNKPGTGTGAGVGVYAPGYGVNANMKPGTTPTPGVAGAPGTNGTSSGDYSSFKNSTQRKIAKGEKKAAADEARGRAAFPEDYIDGPSSPDNNSANGANVLDPAIGQPGASSTNSSQPFSSQQYLEDEYGDIGPEINLDSNNENYDAMYPFDPANSKGIAYNVGGEDVNTSFDDFMKTNPSKEDIDKEVGWRLGRKNRDLDRNVYPNNYDYNLLSPKAYGGYVPSFDPGGQFTGVGPFDPNKNLISDGCSDDDKKDPNNPCYIPAFARPGATIQEMMGVTTNTEKPEDFEVNYDLHKARTIDTNAIANIGAAASAGFQWNNNRKDSNYADEWEFKNLNSDNRDPGASYVDNAGGYSGLSGRNQEVSSNPYIVGQAGFGAKFGGTPNYKEGGTYNMTKNELMQFMAQGGQIEFI
jgi:hypothetical protein